MCNSFLLIASPFVAIHIRCLSNGSSTQELQHNVGSPESTGASRRVHCRRIHYGTHCLLSNEVLCRPGAKCTNTVILASEALSCRSREIATPSIDWRQCQPCYRDQMQLHRIEVKTPAPSKQLLSLRTPQGVHRHDQLCDVWQETVTCQNVLGC